MKIPSRALAILVLVQLGLCVLSAGFSPAVIGAFCLMIAAPIAMQNSMVMWGVLLLSLPGVAAMVLFPAMLQSPVLLGWFALIVVASALCWNRRAKPRGLAAG